jgi:hypothetical protein
VYPKTPPGKTSSASDGSTSTLKTTRYVSLVARILYFFWRACILTEILAQAVGGGRVEFVGTWGHFAFPSGYIFVNSIERGGFVVKLNKK